MAELAVSNIAWTNNEEPSIAKRLQELGVTKIEIAPTKRWDDPTKASLQEIREYVDWWKSYGIDIYSFQSLHFARPDLKLFESPELRKEMAKTAFGLNFTNTPSDVTPANWDMRTKYSALYGGDEGYICSKEQELKDISSFVAAEKEAQV